MNYIYLIQSLNDSYYKIGVSKNPNLRILHLSTGNPSPMKLIDAYPSELSYKIEKVLHRKYEYLRIKDKEWFELSIKEEMSFMETCHQIEKTITELKKTGNPFI